MSKREDLEAALRARPDEATLAVYADFLQSEGDPRGELIALDLRPPSMSMQSVEVRRGQLLRTWLDPDVDVEFDVDRQLWYAGDLSSTHATFEYGFVDLHVSNEDFSGEIIVPRLFRTPASAYLRRVSLSGPSVLIAPLLENLAARPRPWLQQLAISRRYESSWLSPPELSARLVAATPNLEILDLVGGSLLDGFAHPNLRELGVTGSESIDLAAGPPFPALHTIDFAFDGDRLTPRGLFSPERVPALRRVTFARNEPGGDAFFHALGTLAVAPRLTWLEVPSIRTPRDGALVQAAIDRMPMLRELVIARVYAMHGAVPELRHPYARVTVPLAVPWPPRELFDRPLSIDGFMLHAPELVLALEDQYEQLPETLRAIWYRFWTLMDGLHPVEHAFSAQDLATALGGLDLSPHLALLRDHLRKRPHGHVAIVY